MKQPLVSVNIVSWNRKKELQQSLKMLFAGSYENIEVMVVDNASHDGSPEMVKKSFRKVKLLSLKENTAILGRNIGFKKAKGKYILFLDDDSFPKKDAIKHAVQYLEHNQDVSGITMNIQTLNEKRKFADCFKIKHPIDCHFFLGCGVIFRSDIFRKLGGFSPHYFAYGDDWEFAIRLYGMGGKMVFLPDAQVCHLVSSTSRSTKNIVFYATRNSIWTILLNYPLLIAVPIFFWALVREGYFSLRRGYILNWFEGVIAALKGYPQVIKDRKPISYSNLMRFYRVGFNFWRALNSAST
jgi:hypothetical protein